jgi:hypothetical protein
MTCHFVESADLFEAQHLEGVAMERLTFLRAFNDRSSEAFAHTKWLGVVKVSAATWMSLHNRENPFKLLRVRRTKLAECEQTRVEQSSQDHEGTHLEPSSEIQQLFRKIVSVDLNVAQELRRDEEFRSNFIAPPLSRAVHLDTHVNVIDTGIAEGNMNEFVRESEYLRCLGVSTVDENHRRQLVGQSETSKLSRVEFAMRITSDDATHHNENAEAVGCVDEMA